MSLFEASIFYKYTYYFLQIYIIACSVSELNVVDCFLKKLHSDLNCLIERNCGRILQLGEHNTTRPVLANAEVGEVVLWLVVDFQLGLAEFI